MPSAASAGTSSRSQRAACRSISASTRVRISASVARGVLPSSPLLLLRLELVADAVARVNEGVRGCKAIDLRAQFANEHIHGPITVALPASPDALHQLLARDHAPLLECERVQQAELGRCQ